MGYGDGFLVSSGSGGGGGGGLTEAQVLALSRVIDGTPDNLPAAACRPKN